MPLLTLVSNAVSSSRTTSRSRSTVSIRSRATTTTPSRSPINRSPEQIVVPPIATGSPTEPGPWEYGELGETPVQNTGIPTGRIP
ncbi:uncharacterized protein METZ01_LOCUS364355, partial [marine metagenome]